MADVNFNTIGNILGLQTKLLKHMANDDPERVKDYVCAAFDNWNPMDAGNHPCVKILTEAQTFLKEHGWQCGTSDWGEGKGLQVTCVSPEDNWYRSHYNHQKGGVL